MPAGRIFRKSGKRFSAENAARYGLEIRTKTGCWAMTDSRTRDDNAPDTATQDTQASPAEDPAAQAAREAAEYKDRWLRRRAAMETLRRRTGREVGEGRAY